MSAFLVIQDTNWSNIPKYVIRYLQTWTYPETYPEILCFFFFSFFSDKYAFFWRDTPNLVPYLQLGCITGSKYNHLSFSLEGMSQQVPDHWNPNISADVSISRVFIMLNPIFLKAHLTEASTMLATSCSFTLVIMMSLYNGHVRRSKVCQSSSAFFIICFDWT